MINKCHHRNIHMYYGLEFFYFGKGDFKLVGKIDLTSSSGLFSKFDIIPYSSLPTTVPYPVLILRIPCNIIYIRKAKCSRSIIFT